MKKITVGTRSSSPQIEIEIDRLLLYSRWLTAQQQSGVRSQDSDSGSSRSDRSGFRRLGVRWPKIQYQKSRLSNTHPTQGGREDHPVSKNGNIKYQNPKYHDILQMILGNWKLISYDIWYWYLIFKFFLFKCIWYWYLIWKYFWKNYFLP